MEHNYSSLRGCWFIRSFCRHASSLGSTWVSEQPPGLLSDSRLFSSRAKINGKLDPHFEHLHRRSCFKSFNTSHLKFWLERWLHFHWSNRNSIWHIRNPVFAGARAREFWPTAANREHRRGWWRKYSDQIYKCVIRAIWESNNKKSVDCCKL